MFSRLLSRSALLVGLVLASASAASAQALARADVDRDCTVTKADAAIVSSQMGKRTGQAGFTANADVDSNGLINTVDLTFVTRNVGKQVCPLPPPVSPPAITATASPLPNDNGWNNTDVRVTFLCTNAVTCPSTVTVTAEGAAQVVEKTVANSAGVTATARVTLNIDKTAPVLNVTLPASALPGAALTIPVTAVDLSGLAKTTLLVKRQVAATRGVAPFALGWTVPGTSITGVNESLEVLGEDRAGNAASVRRDVRIDSPDTVAPTLGITAPAISAPGALVPVVVQAADDRALGQVTLARVDGSTIVPLERRNADPFSFQSIAEIPAGAPSGSLVTFTAVATDAAGHTTAATATVKVVTTVPGSELKITVDPPASPTFQSSGVITGTIGTANTSITPPATPIVAAVSPTAGRQGQTLDVVITGVNTDFSNLSQANFGPGITVVSTSATDGSHLTARLAVAPNAGAGPRIVAVSTGLREGLLSSGFTVVAGVGTVGGRLLNASGQPVVNAQVCLEGTTICVTSGTDGRFTFGDLPVTSRRVVVTAAGFESAIIPIALSPNGVAALGDLALVVSNLPPPPPLPNSPPIAPKLAAVLGRGATVLGAGGNAEEFKRLIRDAVIAVGGKEMGVLDANGQQLNPRMVGAGYASLTSAAVDEIADDMVAGDSISLAKLFHIFMGSLQFPAAVPLPNLPQLITAFQTSVDNAWADPSRPEAPLLMLLFNHGRVASATPPRVSFDTQFNPLQKNVMTVSFMTFVSRFLTHLPDEQAALQNRNAPVVAHAGWGARLRGLGSLVSPGGDKTGFASTRAVSRGAPSFAASRGPRLPAIFNGGSAAAAFADVPYGPTTAAERPTSLMWETVVSATLPAGGWTAAKKSGKLCDSFLVQLATDHGLQSVDGKSAAGQQLAADPNAKFLPVPECKTAIELIEILMTSGSKAAQEVSERYTKFFLSEGATRDTAQRLQQQFAQTSYKEAFAAAKAEAKALNIASRAVGVARGLAESYLSKVQGAVIDGIFQLEVNLIIESLRPRQPFVKQVEQLTDPETTPASPSRLVKISFSRSPNDKGTYDDPDIMWWYELWRGKGGATRPISGKRFDKTAKELAFYDEVPEDGTYVYAVRARRQVGYPLNEVTVENTFVSKTLDFLGGFFDTTVKIGGQAVFGIGIVKTATQPFADIYKGVRMQWSDPSEPEQIYVSTAPPTPRPPASLVVHPNGKAFLSVPALNTIFQVTNGVLSPFAYANFKAPGQVGLAIDSLGDLYSDNSASDAEFGGRIFSFGAYDGARNIAGTVNYYSQLISFANPVSVQALAIGNGFYGEELFIADATNQRITHMTLPRRFPPGVTTARNVSQPLASSPLFNFGPSTALAVNPNLGLAVTQGNEVMLVPLPGVVQPLFNVSAGGSSPYTNLSGVTYDKYGNMYVSDGTLGTLSMIPTGKQFAYHGLQGLNAIELKKLTVQRGLRRPADLKLASDQDGLAFYDGERAFASLRFGMAGQVTSESGAPVAGVDVFVPDTRQVATTDSDGIYVLPNLVSAEGSPIVDFTIRYQGRTQSFRSVLDRFKHNIVDVVLPAAPAPLPPTPPTRPDPPPPPPSDPPQVKPSGSETVSVAFDFAPRGATIPVQPSCPRAVFVSPGDTIATASPTTIVTGMIANRRFSQALTLASVSLAVNGAATVLPLTRDEFSTTVTLTAGNNLLTISLPASVLKPIGCADPSLDDAAPVIISAAQKIFHDPRADEVARYRLGAGFDKAVRGIVREDGVPLAGITFVVPGTDYEGTTDGDGVFQVNLPTDKLQASTSAADALGDDLFTRLGGIVALLRQSRRADSLDALSGLLAQAIAVGNAPPQAATTIDALLGRILQVEGTARSLIAALQSTEGIPDPADINALEALGTQLAATNSDGKIVVRGREHSQLSITVSVR